MTMIEKVARSMLAAMAEAVPGPQVTYDDGTPIGEAQRKLLAHIARAAIEAMGEPSEAMITAGAVEVGNVDTGHEDSPTWQTAPEAACETWRAMISAALREGE